MESTSGRPFRNNRWLWRRCVTGLLAILCLIFPGILARAGFQFAWLSDTHIGSSAAEEDLRAAVRDINQIRSIGFVVVSGDITEYGSLHQLRLAKEVLDGLGVPYHVLPGNHDCKWSESGATDFPKLFGGDRFDFEHGGIRFIGMHQGPIMKMGDGHWAPQDVRWLAETLKGISDVNQPLVFITHYPIDDGIDNWFEVLELLKRRNTQVVLCGHGHANRSLNFEGIAGIMGRSNLRGKASAGGFNVVEIEQAQITVAEHILGGTTKSPWHKIPLRAQGYFSDTNAYPRPDFGVNKMFPKVKERWVYSAGYTIASTPALCRDLLVAGDASGAVHAISAKTGQERWRFNSGGPTYSSPAFEKGQVFFGSADGQVYALNAADGRKLWSFKGSRPVVASPAVKNNTVYIGSSEGVFRALDARTGRLLWEFQGVAGFVETRPLLLNGHVVFGAWDEHLYSLNQRNGALDWKWAGDRRGTLLSPAACWPVGAGSKIFIVAPDRKMTALDSATGTELWRTGDYVVRESIGISEDNSRVYVRAMNDRFYAFSSAATKPEQLWENNAQFGYDINSAALIEKDGVVFYGTKNGLLFALDGKTGAIRWQHRIGVGLVNTLLPLSRRRVIAADVDGKLVLVEDQS